VAIGPGKAEIHLPLSGTAFLLETRQQHPMDAFF
jgi:hypothetical protein